jgi:hypothetical protein
MRKALFNPLFALALAGAFLFSAVVCCCVKHLAQEQTKSSCCHKAKKDHAKCTDGCSSLVKSAETAKTFDLTSSASSIVAIPDFAAVVYAPAYIIKPVFLNGPPGPFSAVPLYTRFHSLRI